jgi:hypothetical protein
MYVPISLVKHAGNLARGYRKFQVIRLPYIFGRLILIWTGLANGLSWTRIGYP